FADECQPLDQRRSRQAAGYISADAEPGETVHCKGYNVRAPYHEPLDAMAIERFSSIRRIGAVADLNRAIYEAVSGQPSLPWRSCVPNRGVGAYRKGPHSPDLDGYGGKRETRQREFLEIAEMLHDGNIRTEQGGVDRASTVARVVDVERVDPHQRGALVARILSRGAGEERMALEIPIHPPVPCPAGVHKYGLAPQVERQEDLAIDHAVGHPRHADDHRFQICQAA